MKIRLFFFFILFNIGAFAQDFGCFSEPDFIPKRSYIYKSNDEVNIDNLFWENYELPQKVSDGYYCSRWNKYQPQMEGLVVNGKRNGLWKFYFNNKTGYYLGSFVEDRKNGIWRYYGYLGLERDTILLEQFTYKNDSLDGYYYKFIHDTVVKSEYKYLNNKLLAYNIFVFGDDAKFLWRSFIQNDSVSSFERHFGVDGNNQKYCNRLIINDKEKSEEIRYNENGDTLKIIVLENGKLPKTIFDKADSDRKSSFTTPTEPALGNTHSNNGDSIHLKNNFVGDYYWEDYSDSIHRKKVTGKYVVENKENLKDNTWNYFIDEILVASVEYKSGKKIGNSKYYDHDGKLRRIEVYELGGANYSVFDGDTVNLTDSKGLKQKKWIYFWKDRFDSFSGCSDRPNQIRYFVNDTLKYDSSVVIGYYYDPDFLCENQTCYQKILRQDSNIYRCNKFCNQKLVEEGDMVFITNNLEKFGPWKEYDCDKGKLKAEGSYYLDRKVGKWNFYKKNGKVKDVIDYDKRSVRNSNQHKK